MLAAALLTVFVIAGVSGAPRIYERVSSGRPTWLLAAGGFELVSVLGFLAVFGLLFGAWMPEKVTLRVGLVVRAATILLPAGGLVALGAGAKAMRKKGIAAETSAPRMLAFLLITNAPNAAVLAGLGIALGFGLLDGPHGVLDTLLPGLGALAAITLVWYLPRLSHQRDRQVPGGPRHAKLATQLELGVVEARALLAERRPRLLGALAYYALDNAVLWATFKAFGHTHPPLATLAMAYLIGTSAGSLPLPAGVGAVEGGMIGLLVLYGAPAICAGIAVLAYRAVSTGLPLALGGLGLLALGRPALRGRTPRAI